MPFAACGHNDEFITADGDIECGDCGGVWQGVELGWIAPLTK